MLRFLLLPFAVLYQLITSIRNYLYDKQFLPIVQPEIPSITVGNLRVGGTGKTPHLVYLVELLAKNYQITTLSRGYGRKTKGFLIADSQSQASTIGDEPLLLFHRFSPTIHVSVGENRVQAVEKIKKNLPATQLLLLDDAFQHRPLKAHLNLLLTEYAQPFYEDFLLPTGRLREGRRGAKRANAIVVTKCPTNLSIEEQAKIKAKIAPYLPDRQVPIFFSAINYQQLQPVYAHTYTHAHTQGKQPIQEKQNQQQPIILLTGIANATPLRQELGKNYQLLAHLDFADHYVYTPADAEKLLKIYQNLQDQQPIIVATEKDFVKLQEPQLATYLCKLPLFYLPITIKFLPNELDFDRWLQKQLDNMIVPHKYN